MADISITARIRNNNSVEVWKSRVEVSKRKFKPLNDNIKVNRNYYRGNQWRTSTGDDDFIDRFKNKAVDNMVFANIQTIRPSINFRNPRIFVGAKKKPFLKDQVLFDTTASALILEMVLNHYYVELEIKRQVDKALTDALIGPWGFIQIGYTFETEAIDDGDELIQSNSPFVKRISPMDVIVDSSAKDSHLEDAEWMAFRWVKRLEDVKKSKKYKNTATLKANHVVKTDFNSSESTSTSMNIQGDAEEWSRVEGWDIWDKKNNKLITYVSGHDKFLQDREWPLDFDGFPVEVLFFNENPDELFPVGDVDIYRYSQDELNMVRSMQLDHISRISSRKFVAKDTAFDDNATEERKLMFGGDGTVLFTKGDPTTAIVPLKDANVSQDMYLTLNQLKQAIREGQGIAVFEQGVGQKFDTATEPALIAQGVSTRRAERGAILEDFLKRTMRKVAQILQQTMESTEVPLTTEQFDEVRQPAEGRLGNIKNRLAKIAGPEESTILSPWLTDVSKDDIQGEYEYNIDVGSTKPINEQERKKDILELSNLIGNSPQFAGLIKPGEALKRIFEAYDVRDFEKLLKSPEELQAEQEAAAQEIDPELERQQLKSQTDLQKTQMKSETQLQTAAMKSQTEVQTTLLKGLGSKGE